MRWCTYNNLLLFTLISYKDVSLQKQLFRAMIKETPKFTYRQNQSIKVHLFVYMCLYPLPTLRGFQQILDPAKILFFFENVQDLFGRR